ncbi:MAG: methyltransferase domain-containing protein [Anaerolineae bacterium]|nr:methyltransferase domain-containing protein [Anaerolineae bacterium]MDW8071352.1 methyltransferase domain-containing protein [Anaerolineae bacterium]
MPDANTEPTWKRYLSDYNEGLGLVYERLVLGRYLERLWERFGIRSVLEAPLYGMAGVSGINSVPLARRGCTVTLVDEVAERLQGVQRIWQQLDLPVHLVLHRDFSCLPFADGTFDLAWQWAGLWYLPDPAGLLRELVRVSRRLVFVAMPNPLQPGYLLRKYLLERAFFDTVAEEWTDIGRIKRVLRAAGLHLIEEGVMDIPPWPDTVMPAAEVLRRLGIGSPRLHARFTGERWNWSTMAYYLGQRPDLPARVMRYAWLEDLPLPWQLKLGWAHHRYVLGTVERA